MIQFVDSPGLSIVVLAAGFSRRLGRSKVSARIRGRTLLQAAVRTLAPLAHRRLILVVPPRAARLRADLARHPVLFAPNPRRAEGLSSSVRSGLRQARYSAAVLLVPCDLVCLERRDVARLIARWQGARRRVTARRIGSSGGVPLILPRGLMAWASKTSGDSGLRELLRGLPREALALVDMPSARADVDTPRDLSEARRRPRAWRRTSQA